MTRANHRDLIRYDMKSDKGRNLTPRPKARRSASSRASIEKDFVECVAYLKGDLRVDGIDVLGDRAGFRVRSHDLHGPLPEIRLRDSGYACVNRSQLWNSTCRLLAISRLRKELKRLLPDGEPLPPKIVGSKVIAGLRVGPRIWLAEGEDSLAAHLELYWQGVNPDGFSSERQCGAS